MKKYRNEWKYCCNDGDLRLLEARIKDALLLDTYTDDDGRYVVHSLYFDDYYNTCALDTEAGLPKRFKWRIRYYGDDLNTLHLELKEKLYGRCFKKSCALSIDEYSQLIDGNIQDILWKTDKELLKEFCLAIMTKHFVPKVIIDYERTAYVEPISNIRITLDMNIVCAYDFDQFLIGNYQVFPLQKQRCQVLEVKFDDILPSYVRNLVSSYGFYQTSFSKYYEGRKKLEEVLK